MNAQTVAVFGGILGIMTIWSICVLLSRGFDYLSTPRDMANTEFVRSARDTPLRSFNDNFLKATAVGWFIIVGLTLKGY